MGKLERPALSIYASLNRLSAPVSPESDEVTEGISRKKLEHQERLEKSLKAPLPAANKVNDVRVLELREVRFLDLQLPDNLISRLPLGGGCGAGRCRAVQYGIVWNGKTGRGSVR